MSDDTRERIAEDLAVILRQKGLHGWLKMEPLPLARSIVEAMLEITRCDFQEDSVRGDVGGPCRKLRGHDGDHHPFERVTPDRLRETFGLPPVEEMRSRNETSVRLYGAGWEDVRAGAALASALMAANYAGDSGEDVDRLIAEILARGYRLARLLPVAAVAAEDRLLSLVDDQLSHSDYKDIETWLTAIKDAAYDAGWDAAMRDRDG